MKLVTLDEYNKLPPRSQGYVVYMEAEWPGSELKQHQANPYPENSSEWSLWREGQQQAVLVAQDSEE